ncbi:UNVERIFIED_CONTAM: hypothetical protein K2H54_031421 [Gekko kuhli]
MAFVRSKWCHFQALSTCSPHHSHFVETSCWSFLLQNPFQAQEIHSPFFPSSFLLLRSSNQLFKSPQQVKMHHFSSLFISGESHLLRQEGGAERHQRLQGTQCSSSQESFSGLCNAPSSVCLNVDQAHL